MKIPILIVAALAVLLGGAPASHAGLGDALKKKVEKAAKKVENATDKAGDKAESGEKAASEEKGEEAGGSGGAAEKVSEVSTKFDFVPGDSVLFADDFTEDELGEFPAKWKLVQGTFEVAEREGERWLRGMSNDGYIRLKLPFTGPLPELWTLEFDFFGTEPLASAITVRALGDNETVAWEATYPHDTNLFFRSGEVFSSTLLENSTVGGRHHFMFMARGKAIKAYMDNQRLASVPEIMDKAGAPSVLEIRLWAPTKPMITNVRLAQGPRPAKDLLASGKLVTHGIRFATGSDVVLPDSAPILRQVASWMEANQAAKLRITGHTDNVGSAASNLDLSKRRAASVARVLSTELGVSADRFATDGKGDTQAMASNAKPEGRAMNRRVEFAKQ
jgi:outer membrane protein OmpA-like peptidoglycan-associated protein